MQLIGDRVNGGLGRVVSSHENFEIFENLTFGKDFEIFDFFFGKIDFSKISKFPRHILSSKISQS